MARRQVRALFVLGLSLTTNGCRGCHDNKPYTPYHLGDSPSGSAAADVPAPASTLAPDAGYEATPATAPKGDGKTWMLGDVEVKAPVGRTFGLGVELEGEGGKPSLLAWAKTPDGLRGELVFASSAAPEAKTVAALPGELAPSGCTAKTALVRFGPRSIAFDFKPNCPSAPLRERATRWIGIVRFPDPADGKAAAPELGLEIKIAALADGVTLEPAFESIDKDGDGRRDVVVTLTMNGAPKPLAAAPASASLIFFDRPAGLSRDPSEPAASLKVAAATIFSDAHRPKGAAKVAAEAGAIRRLIGALCEEGGHPLVTTSGGSVRCGETKSDSEIAYAELEAAVNLGEPVAAVAALARIDLLGKDGPRKKDVDRLTSKLLPSVTPTDVKTLTAVPAANAVMGFGPLAFLANGDLLVRTAQGIVKADATLAESPAEPRTWMTGLAYPPAESTWKLVGAERRCTMPSLVAHFEVKGAAPEAGELALPIPTPARCAPGSLTAISLGQNSGGALVAFGLEVVQIPLANTPTANLPESLKAEPLAEEQLGAARSPDGVALALPTARGVLVAAVEGSGKKAKAALWSGPELNQASFCVPANAGKRLACVAQGKAIVATR
jgi:hypothetical protein